ncbi:MAG: endonuclease MutS2 [Thermodesulfobacteriota bacterium]
MDDRSLKALEFYQLLEVLKTFSVSPLGRKRCEALRPSTDLPSIHSRLAEVLELKGVLEAAEDIPLGGLKNIESIFKKLEVEGSVLSVQELLDIHQQIELCKGLKRFFQKLNVKETPRLQEKISKLSTLKTLEKEILQAISMKGEILDRASPMLKEIRQQLAEIREKAKAVLEHLLHRKDIESIFQEQFITLRSGRYVLLIKSDYKHRLKGIIHDQSQSRMSYFFEPLEVVNLNNEISILLGEEKEEQDRILTELSNRVREERHHLWSDFEILGELDLLYAMAKLAIQLKGVEPILSENGRIDLREARNPILSFQKGEGVVPINLRMGDGIKTLIISGANAGGKTVALKTLGLLSLMVQSGLPIPVKEGSHAVIFDNILAVIGDEQNLEENLSTFSSHLLHLNQILEKAGPRSLILLDELGVGTHASEGCALAMAFLDRFREKGSSIVVTTHFDRLKAYGYLHPDVENVAVAFDEETLEPQYTLRYGVSGLSNAFLVAEKFGISEEVLRLARQHQDGGEQEVSRVLERLERLRTDAEKERMELLQAKEEVARERRRLKELIEGIKKRRQEIYAQAEEKARASVLRVEEELRNWIQRWKEEKDRSKSSRITLPRREIQEVKEKVLPPVRVMAREGQAGGIRVGDRVRILSLRTEGVVVEVEESSKQVEVTTEHAKVRTSFSDIVRAREAEDGKVEPLQGRLLESEGKEVPSQLNVIGLRVEDALPQVDKFIDQALLHGLQRVQIIHGVGSGRLREAIGKYLQGHQGVKGFAPGDTARGGRAITVVDLR